MRSQKLKKLKKPNFQFVSLFRDRIVWELQNPSVLQTFLWRTSHLKIALKIGFLTLSKNLVHLQVSALWRMKTKCPRALDLFASKLLKMLRKLLTISLNLRQTKKIETKRVFMSVSLRIRVNERQNLRNLLSNSKKACNFWIWLLETLILTALKRSSKNFSQTLVRFVLWNWFQNTKSVLSVLLIEKRQEWPGKMQISYSETEDLMLSSVNLKSRDKRDRRKCGIDVFLISKKPLNTRKITPISLLWSLLSQCSWASYKTLIKVEVWEWILNLGLITKIIKILPHTITTLVG